MIESIFMIILLKREKRLIQGSDLLSSVTKNTIPAILSDPAFYLLSNTRLDVNHLKRQERCPGTSNH